MRKKLPPGFKDSWKRGEGSYFEYHCNPSHQSCDAEAWYHSQQPVTVLSVVEKGVGPTLMERGKAGMPRVYRVRFSDGLEYDVFEDELLTAPKYYGERFAPPKTRRER